MTELSDEVQRTLGDALSAFSRGDIGDAVSLLDAASLEHRTYQQVHDLFALRCMRASIAAMSGERSISSYMADVSSSHMHNAVVLYLEGLAAMASGTGLQTASVKFEEASRADPHFVIARLGLAAVHYYRGHYKESFSQYRVVLQTLGSKAPPIVRVGMGLCAYRLNRLDYAQKMLERALEVNSDDELALLVLLVIFLDCRQMSKVIEVVGRLRLILPTNAVVILKVSDLVYFRAVAQGRVKAFAPSISRLLTEVRGVANLEEAAIADYQEGRLNMALGNFSKARVLLDAALQTLPNLLAARIHYARLLLLSGKDKESEQMLLRINAEHPNQKEVLLMLGAQAARLGLHERALECSKRLTEGVAPEDIRSWSLASWCARLNKEEARKFSSLVARIQKEMGKTTPTQLLVNIATLNKDVDGLQRILDQELGADVLSLPTLAVAHIPIVFNLALLLEEKDRVRSRQLYIFLVKKHGYFQLPYFRLHELAKTDGLLKQAVAWLVLLQQIVPDEPYSIASLGQLLFEQQRFMASLSVLRSVKGRPLPVVLGLGAAYLRCGQHHWEDSRRFVSGARDRFSFVLRRDKGNMLAAHGLACCLGLEGQYECCQSLLDRVGEVLPNCQYIRRHYGAHMANAKILSGSFKQARDYLERDKQRTPLQMSSLAFCLLSEERYSEAIAVLTEAMDACPNHSFLLYNLALVHCASFVASVSSKQALTIDEARSLRRSLATGLEIANRFIKINGNSQTLRVAQTFLRFVCIYCVDLNDREIKKLIAAGLQAAAEFEKQNELWRRVFGSYIEEKRAADERREADERKRCEQEQQLAREILEGFNRARGGETAKFNGDTDNWVGTHQEDISADPTSRHLFEDENIAHSQSDTMSGKEVYGTPEVGEIGSTAEQADPSEEVPTNAGNGNGRQE
ncbi:putative Tetratricopeptide repeat [Trypanosoma vivax]|nr:putative Tetratricopeptide repeat [Trypanosoma vivax]